MVSTRKVHQADRPPFEAWLDSLELSAETKEKLSAVSSIPGLRFCVSSIWMTQRFRQPWFFHIANSTP